MVVASNDTKKLLRLRVSEILKIREGIKFGWVHNLVPNLLSKNNFLAKAIKNYEKASIKVFCFFPVLLDF